MVSKSKKETEVTKLKYEISFLQQLVDNLMKLNNKAENRLLDVQRSIETLEIQIKALKSTNNDLWDNVEKLERGLNDKRNTES